MAYSSEEHRKAITHQALKHNSKATKAIAEKNNSGWTNSNEIILDDGVDQITLAIEI